MAQAGDLVRTADSVDEVPAKTFRFAGLKKDKFVEGEFEVPGEPTKLWLKIDANKWTPNRLMELNEEMAEHVKYNTGLQMETVQSMAMAVMLSEVIVDWGAEDEDPTREFFMDQPIGFLTDLILFCKELINPDPKGKRRKG